MMLRNVFLVLQAVILLVSCDHVSDKEDMINVEKKLIVGGNLTLSPQEEQANEILMRVKYEEFDAGFQDPSTFLPARHFFEAKAAIENSKVFQIIKMVPKGASLHSHDEALASFEFVYNLTYLENLYACTTENNRLRLHFFSTPDDTCGWQLLSEIRNSNTTYDDWLKTQITIVVDNPDSVYTDINKVWTAFINSFITVEEMITYAPVWKDYFYQALKELYDDNVRYIEFRTVAPTCYDLDGNTYNTTEVIGFYKEVADKFKQDYPDFNGVRIIYAPIRAVDEATVDKYVETTLEINAMFGDFLAGFDLVGQEDLGQPLEQFIPQLLSLKDNGIRLFHHAGETNWYGSSTDLNLLDAVLLDVVRIGHGYAIVKHPEVARLVKEKGIGIEINPISNQVLKLVDDLRNHPANQLIANGFPVVICNDDPGLWGAKALSYDWYEAFMGMTSRETDLRFLKQLAMNSYLYSGMPLEEKSKALERWNIEWMKFVMTVISQSK